MTYHLNTCRFCKKTQVSRYGHSDRLVKYGYRHYACHECYLDAGKPLADLSVTELDNFPFMLLSKRGLLLRVREILAEKRKEVLNVGQDRARPDRGAD